MLRYKLYCVPSSILYKWKRAHPFPPMAFPITISFSFLSFEWQRVLFYMLWSSGDATVPSLDEQTQIQWTSTSRSRRRRFVTNSFDVGVHSNVRDELHTLVYSTLPSAEVGGQFDLVSESYGTYTNGLRIRDKLLKVSLLPEFRVFTQFSTQFRAF
jgi:hypothetical protein